MVRLLEFVFAFVLLLGLGIALIGLYDSVTSPTTVTTVTVAEVCKDEFGFAIKTESGKCIQIHGGSEACFLGLKIGTKITVPDSSKKIYYINIEAIE
jgi:phosphotransferase system IIA component